MVFSRLKGSLRHSLQQEYEGEQESGARHHDSRGMPAVVAFDRRRSRGLDRRLVLHVPLSFCAAYLRNSEAHPVGAGSASSFDISLTVEDISRYSVLQGGAEPPA
jgi:hypothetical protein